VNHLAHVRFAWEQLAQGGLSTALIRVPAFLRGVATGAGAPERYHETLTIGFVLLIADRFEPAETFDDFAVRNPDLLADRAVLERYWRSETLASDRARSRFVFPDRGRGA
jgi:hypothetical protein